MSDYIIDFSACQISGGVELVNRVQAAAENYSPQSIEYFEYLTEKSSKSVRAFRESACAFLLLDNLLLKHGIERREISLCRDENGRPGVSGRQDVDFSISHSEGVAFCCLCIGENAAVGCDIQHVRDYSREYLERLARTFMSKQQLEDFLISSDREKFFYTAWTQREAEYKRCGVYPGLTLEKDGEAACGCLSTGIINACTGKYYYSISAVQSAEKEIQ